MKATLKGGNRVVRFLLSHGEKIGIAVFLVCAAMLIWSSLGRDHLGDDKQPDRLDSIQKSALTKVDSFTYNQLPEEEKHLARTYSGQAIKAVDPGSFPPWERNMDRPVITTSGPRTDPLLLTAIDLEVTSDSGLWALGDRETADQRRFDMIKEAKEKERERQSQLDRNNRDNNRGDNRAGPGRPGGEDMYGGGGEGGGGYGDNRRGKRDNARRRTRQKEQAVIMRPRAGVKLTGAERVVEKSWVTVVARVPIRDQYQLYEDALSKSSGYMPNRDIPNYVGYVVERAEVTPAGQGEWTKLETIAHAPLMNMMKKWPENPPTVVDSKVFHPILTYPLPPLLLRGWGEEVTHSTMPLASSVSDRMENETDESSEEKPEEDPENEKDIFDNGSGDRLAGGAAGRREGPARGMFSDEGMGRGRGGGEEMNGGGRMGYGDEGGMGYGGRGGEGMGFGMGYGSGYGRLGSEGQNIGKINLGSFQYNGRESHILLRYFDSRVQPGHRYAYRFRLVLTDVNNNVREKYLNPEVVARRKKSKNLKYRFTDWSDPSPVIGVPLSGRVFVAGTQPARERIVDDEPSAKLMVRALNTEPPAEIALAKPFNRGSVINAHDKAAVIWADRYNPEDRTEFDFLTGITLLDCTGGESLGRKDLTAPARALVMDSAGRLMVHSELEDRLDVEEFEQAIKTGDNRRGGGYGGPRGGGGGMYGDEGMSEEGMYGRPNR